MIAAAKAHASVGTADSRRERVRNRRSGHDCERAGPERGRERAQHGTFRNAQLCEPLGVIDQHGHGLAGRPALEGHQVRDGGTRLRPGGKTPDRLGWKCHEAISLEVIQRIVEVVGSSGSGV